MSRRFADVGIGIPPARLQEIAAGAPCLDAELTNVNFALVATEIQHQQRVARSARQHRCVIHWLIVVGLILVVLNALICMGYAILSLVEPASSF